VRHLLDVNVLAQLVGPAHVQHETVHAGFARVGHKSRVTDSYLLALALI